jgi:hypothetical protein
MSIMAYSGDDEDEVGHGTRNVYSGWSTNSVQARDIHGDINFHASERDYITALPWGFTVAIYAALFIVVSGYAFAVGSLDLSFWNWVKLVLSTVVLVPVFIATDFRLHGDEFLALRVLCSLVIVGLAIGEGPKIATTKGIVTLVGRWLIWQF